MTSSSTSIWSATEPPEAAVPQTLEAFLASVEQRAFRIVRYAIHHEEDALDIVQDAMLKLVKRYSKRPCDEWAPLFHRILQNGITDYHRRQKTRKRWLSWFDQFSEDGEESVQDRFADEQGLDGERQLEVDQSFSAINAALEALPRRQQQVFLLRCWEGLSTRDTALAMGCSEGSVKTHYFRALNALKNQLTELQP